MTGLSTELAEHVAPATGTPGQPQHPLHPGCRLGCICSCPRLSQGTAVLILPLPGGKPWRAVFLPEGDAWKYWVTRTEGSLLGRGQGCQVL